MLISDWTNESVETTVTFVPADVAVYVISVAYVVPVFVVTSVAGSNAPSSVIPQAKPASYPEKPKTLVTNNWFDCDKYDLAMYGNSYWGAPVSLTLVAFKPPKKDWNSP